MLEKKLKEVEAKVDVLLQTNGKLELRVEQLKEENESSKEEVRRLNARKDRISTTSIVDETSRTVDARGSHDSYGKANAMGLSGQKRKVNVVGDEDRNEVYTTMAKDILLSHNSNFLFASSVNKGNKLFRQIAENYVGVQATIDLNNQPSVWTAASEIISTMETIHPGCRFLKQKKEDKSVYTTLTRAEEIGVAVKLINELDRHADERSAKQNADIQFPLDSDVISSDRNLGFEHKGNLKLHELASSHKDEYESTKLGGKYLVGRRIVKEMKENGTRFLKQVPDGFWYELSDKQATDLVCDMISRKLGPKKARGCTISSSSKTAAPSSPSNTNGDAINAVSPCMERRPVHSMYNNHSSSTTNHCVLPLVPQLPLSNANHECLPHTEIIYRQRLAQLRTPVQLFSDVLNNPTSFPSGGSKRRIAQVQRYLPSDTPSASSTHRRLQEEGGVGSGFLCPRCYEHMSYDQKEGCGRCGLMCHYVPGQGVIITTGRDEACPNRMRVGN